MTKTPSTTSGREAWRAQARAELKGQDPASLDQRLASGLEVKALYGSEDWSPPPNQAEALPGAWPYTRGHKATMYRGRPWTIRQYAGFSTAEESNAFYRRNLAAGQKGLSVAFDLATHRGYDSDHPRVAGDVGMAGVAIDSVEDMKVLFDGIPLSKMSVSMTMNGAVLPVLASFIVAGEEQGSTQQQLSGTIQNDILKEFMVRNTYIYPPAPSMRIVADIVAYTAQHMPKFNSISISGYHMQEAGANEVQELAFTLANGLEYLRSVTERGLAVDAFAPRLSFFFAIGMDFFVEVAKLRAARRLWAELIRERFDPQDPRSCMLRTHCQTSGVSLQAQDPMNNIVRTTIEALAATCGGTQSLHTNAYDEALALPSEASARVARNTQLILQHEAGLSRTIDPLAGSYYVESLTDQLVAEARGLIEKVDALGGMTRAVEQGWPMAEIQASAAASQARIDAGETVIVGVNRFAPPESPPPDILQIDNQAVRAAQIARLDALRKARDPQRCAATLAAIEAAARDGSGNLLELSIEAARARATVGEISAALEAVWGRYQATTTAVGDIYANTLGDAAQSAALTAALARFSEVSGGAKPRLYLAKLGQDGHDRGAKVVASAFGDLGFDVILGQLFQTPEEAALSALESGAHLVGVSSLAAAHKTLVPPLIEALERLSPKPLPVIVGGVIPEQDQALLESAGVAAIFGPGTNLAQAAEQVLQLAIDAARRGHNRPGERIELGETA